MLTQDDGAGQACLGPWRVSQVGIYWGNGKEPTSVNLSAAQTGTCAYGDFDLGAFLERLVEIGHDGGEGTLILIHSRMRARGANAFMETCQVALEAGPCNLLTGTLPVVEGETA